MSASQNTRVLHYIRNLSATDTNQLPDQELLGRFITGRDPVAFEVLVRRYGPMVFRLCRRILVNEHDAEDALQATFLVLARRPDAVRSHASVGSWLYGVARHIAVRAKTASGRRLAQEMRSHERSPTDPWEEITAAEVQEILDQELHRLPEKFRAPVVLCCLEGLARDEAAQRLGWTTSVLKSRLEQARERLRARLSRRGVTFTGAFGVSLLGDGAIGTPSAALLESTLQAASVVAAGGETASVVSTEVAALTKGVLNEMFVNKLKTLVLVALGVSLMLIGSGVVAYRTAFAQSPVTLTKGEEKKPNAATDKEKLQGTWEVVELKKEGETVLPAKDLNGKVVFEGDKFRFVLTPKGKGDITRTAATFTLGSTKSPKTFDATLTEGLAKGKVLLGLYEVKGDTLKLCLTQDPSSPRPTEFKAKLGDDNVVLFTLKRVKK